jgi:hypothetical protein
MGVAFALVNACLKCFGLWVLSLLPEFVGVPCAPHNPPPIPVGSVSDASIDAVIVQNSVQRLFIQIAFCRQKFNLNLFCVLLCCLLLVCRAKSKIRVSRFCRQKCNLFAVAPVAVCWVLPSF